MAAALLASACAARVANMMSEVPAMNWVYVHPVPRVGDFARHRSEDGYVMRYELVSERDGVFEARVSWEKTGVADAFLKDMVWTYHLGADGSVKQAHLTARGERRPLRIAEPGDAGFVDPQPLALDPAEDLRTPVGAFRVRQVTMYEMNMNVGAGTTVRMTNVCYIDPSVPFGVVKRQETSAADTPLIDLLQAANEAQKMNLVVSTLVDFMLERGKTSLRSWELVEHGRGPRKS